MSPLDGSGFGPAGLSREASFDDMRITVSRFSSKLAKHGIGKVLTWTEIQGAFSRRREGDKDGVGFIPARLAREPQGTRRRDEDVVSRTAIALDIEANKLTGELPPPVATAVARIREAGYAAIVYTSHNHNPPSDPRYRVLLPLTAEIAPEPPAPEIVADKLGLLGVLDLSKVGARSLFYLPSCAPGHAAQHSTTIIDGDPVDADWLAEAAGAVLAERKAEAERITAEHRAVRDQRLAEKIAAGFNPDESLIKRLHSRLDMTSVLLSHGYDQRGKGFRHPASESGSYGACIFVGKDGIERLKSLNASDPLATENLPSWCGGVKAVDVVDTAIILDHAGDRTKGLAALAERFGLDKREERRAISRLTGKMLWDGAAKDDAIAAVAAEGERLGLSRAEAMGAALYVISKEAGAGGEGFDQYDTALANGRARQEPPSYFGYDWTTGTQKDAAERNTDGHATGSQRPATDPEGGEDRGANLRALLSIDAWAGRDIPEPDRLLGDLITTTTRVFLVGRTGLGKTLLGIGIAAGVASGGGFLHWRSDRPARVLYLDGEMPAELIKPRARDAIRRLGGATIPSGNLLIFGRDIDDEARRVCPGLPPFAPLNTEGGRKFLLALLKAIGGVDLVVFDNVMSLIAGDQKDEVPWSETLPLVQELTNRRVGQVWLDHTGHNSDRQYGSSTKAWRFDAVGCMSPLAGGDPRTTGFTLSFEHPGKARRRTPDNCQQFETQTIRLQDDRWTSEPTQPVQGGNKSERPRPAAVAQHKALLDALVISPTPGKTTAERWYAECVRLGLHQAVAPDANYRERDRTMKTFRTYMSHLKVAGWIGVDGENVTNLQAGT